MVSPIIDGGDAGIDTGFKAPDSVGTIGGKEVVVTTPDRVAIQPYVEPDRTIMVRKLKPRVEARAKRPEHTSKEMSDDLEGEPEVKIKAKTKVITPDGQDITSQIEDEFDYLAKTKGLEIGTERCNKLQKIVDKLVIASGNEKWRGKTQVVILTKGLNPEAMAYPDGTIFISQSLINLFDSIDEVAAVLGHEVHHLTNETFLKSSRANNTNGEGFGVKWFHEMTSDFGSAEVLNECGFRTKAMKDVLLKLNDFFGNRRGYEHQAPIIRAIEQFMFHMTKDFENSNKAATPLPKEFFAKPKETNFEILQHIVTEGNPEEIIPALNKLHKRDLRKVLKCLTQTNHIDNFFHLNDKPNNDKRKEADYRLERARWELQKFIQEKTHKLGLTDEETKLFLFRHNLVSFSGLIEINTLVMTANKMDNDGTIKQTNLSIFDGEIEKDPFTLDPPILLDRIIDWVRFYTYNTNFSVTEVMYSNEQDFVDFVGKISECISSKLPLVNDGEFVNKDGNRLSLIFISQYPEVEIQRNLNRLVLEYIRHITVKEKTVEIPHEKIINLFKSLKTAGFSFREIYDENNSTLKPYEDGTHGIFNEKNDPTRKSIENAHREVYGSELVIRKPESQKVTFPTFEEFKIKVSKLSSNKISEYLRNIYHNNRLQENSPEKLEYRKKYVGYVKYLIDQSFVESEDSLNESVIDALEAHLTDTEFTNFKYRGNLKGYGVEKTTIDELIELKKIDKQKLYEEAIVLHRERVLQGSISQIIERSRNNEEIAYELLEYFMTNPNSKIDISSTNTTFLYSSLRSVFNFLDKESAFFENNNGIGNFQRFYELPYVQELVERFQKPLHFENLAELLDFTKVSEFSEILRLIKTNYENPLFRDSMDSAILLGQLRSELARLSEPGKIQTTDFPVLIHIIEQLLPNSNEAKVLVRQMNLYVLKDPNRTIKEKIDFYMSKYEELGIEGALIVGDQITDLATFLNFKKLSGELYENYLKGKKGLTGVAAIDFESTELVKDAKLLVKTASRNPKEITESSTDFAKVWLLWVADAQDNIGIKWTKFNKKLKRIQVRSDHKGVFKSFVETIGILKNMKVSDRLSISIKALTDQGGLLTTVEGRVQLISFLKSALSLKHGFISLILEKAITKGETSLLGLVGSKMLAPLLFSNLSANSVNIRDIRNNNIDEDRKLIIEQDFVDNLGYILPRETKNILGYGLVYQNQPNCTPAKEATISTKIYEKVIADLTLQVRVLAQVEDGDNSENKSKLPVSTEAIIQAGESSALFIRAMQMAVQVMDFSPAVRERLAMTQDKMQGQSKLAFWDNMLGRTLEGKVQYDPEFATFMRDRFISLDNYLGGGSLFTTYAATIKGENGQPEKVILKMLSPNAESNNEDIYNLSVSTLTNLIETSKGEIRDQAKLALTLLTLSYQWCKEDINDPNYIERDDKFRKTIEDFNQIHGGVIVDASDRVFTSKKIKVEARSKGVTLNTLFDDRNVDSKTKSLLVERLNQFFDHQFIYPHTDKEGKVSYIFHSDPHAGNYMFDVSAGLDAPLSVIDRSMFLELDRDENEMFKLLKNGKGTQFVQTFIKRCLELNGIDKSESEREIRTINSELAVEKIKQKGLGKENTAKFLEIIMSRFVKYGEKYTCTENAIPNDDKSRIILDYLKKMPNRNSIRAFEDLQQNQDFVDLRLTFEDFTQTLTEMTKYGLLTRKAIDVPIKYRLMIRNIVAMQNLTKRFNANK